MDGKNAKHKMIFINLVVVLKKYFICFQIIVILKKN
jgi:hypothetical protein